MERPIRYPAYAQGIAAGGSGEPGDQQDLCGEYSSDTVTVIDGATNLTATVSVGKFPYAIAVNPVTNKIYVANESSNSVTVIDGATNATTAAIAGLSPWAITVNPVTGKIYVANYSGNNVTVLTEAPANDTKVWAIADLLPWNSCFLSKPTLSGKAVNRAFTNKCGIQGVFNRLNTAQTVWNSASITSMAGTDSTRWSYNWGTTDSLIPGENYLCLFAADSQCGTTNNLGIGTPFTGNVTVYPLYYLTGIPTPVSPGNGRTNLSTSLTLSWGTVSTAAGYAIQISSNASFLTLFVNQSGIASGNTTVSGFPNNTRYYWRVASMNTGGTGAWSVVWSFTVGVSSVIPRGKIITGPSFSLKNGTIAYSLDRQSSVGLRIYDMRGEKVFEFTRLQPSGSYSVPLKMLDLSPGRYVAQFIAEGLEQRMLVILSK